MVVVFHDPQATGANAEKLSKNFVEYGKRLEAMLSELQPSLPQAAD